MPTTTATPPERSKTKTKTPSRRRPLLPSSTRPPKTTSSHPPTLSSRRTRTLVRTHHNHLKLLSHALVSNNTALADSIQEKIATNGGLDLYQKASLQGQSASRGGDSSRVLVEWLDAAATGSRSGCLETPPEGKESVKSTGSSEEKPKRRLRLLEVGALHPWNAIARSPLFADGDIERIDLNPQHPSISQQDFMERPVLDHGSREGEGFDIVSLSLVVNFVGEAGGRGEMLRRVGGFLRRAEERGGGGEVEEGEELLPALFLVLPAACVMNSRYLDEERLEGMMRHLGYRLVKRKVSAKLVYCLWRLEKVEEGEGDGGRFGKKEEVRGGGGRNNFAILLR